MTETERAVETVWRVERARLVAGLARMVHDLSRAEDLAQDALVAALERWPHDGVPDNPGAWLMTTAKNRAIDGIRHDRTFERKREELVREAGLRLDHSRVGIDLSPEEEYGDDMLALIFACCAPALPREARVVLTLQVVGGLTAAEIARAHLAKESAVAQRLVRTKRALREGGARFEVPSASEVERGLPDVLEVIYLIFNEGYAANAGEDWMRPGLCREALRMARVLAELAPAEPEAHGLASLLETQSSRLPARLGPGGEPILLLDQDRARWDPLLIVRGRRALEAAEALPRPLGPYGLQAAIAACHGRALVAEETDWVRIAALYEVLGAVAPSPVVEVNRAVAVGMAFGPETGLEVLAAVAEDPALADYHLVQSVRGDLLERAGREEEARAEFLRAAELAENERERALLRRRAGA